MSDSAPIDFVNAAEACRMIGGEKSPIGLSTLYRGVAAGRYPKPIHVSPHVVRWVRADVESAVRSIVEAAGK